jgi:dsRNA-specific ribonuclease
MEKQTDVEIYLGSRGDDFIEFIRSLLERGKLNNEYIKQMTTENNMKVYADAFTAISADPVRNWEVLEQLGDLSINKFIVSYMYHRFPQIRCTEGVKVAARLRINYGSKDSFFNIANKLGFWKYISADVNDRSRKMKPLIEDAFEAFIGATEQILDNKHLIGVGYSVVYDILANIFDKIDISLKYEDLYDAKTRLKELFDINSGTLGVLIYENNKSEIDMVTNSTVYRIVGGRAEGKKANRKIVGGTSIVLGKGTASLQADAEQKAATAGLSKLKKEGYTKTVPLFYEYLCQ